MNDRYYPSDAVTEAFFEGAPKDEFGWTLQNIDYGEFASRWAAALKVLEKEKVK